MIVTIYLKPDLKCIMEAEILLEITVAVFVLFHRIN